MHLRTAEPGDVRVIAQIHARAWQEGYKGLMPEAFLACRSLSYRTEYWEMRIAEPNLAVIVCEQESVVTGWLEYGPSEGAAAAPDTGEIKALNVDPGRWGQGAGSALCAAACSRLSDAGFRQVVLWVLLGNHRGRAFYEHIGFEQDVRVRDQFQAGEAVIPELLYRRAL